MLGRASQQNWNLIKLYHVFSISSTPSARFTSPHSLAHSSHPPSLRSLFSSSHDDDDIENFYFSHSALTWLAGCLYFWHKEETVTIRRGWTSENSVIELHLTKWLADPPSRIQLVYSCCTDMHSINLNQLDSSLSDMKTFSLIMSSRISSNPLTFPIPSEE